MEGFASDEGRKVLILESIKVGLENPILGAGYDELHAEMAKRLGITHYGFTKIDTHFLIGYIFGASGFFSLLCFVLFFVGLPHYYYVRSDVPVFIKKNIQKTRILLISFILLYVTRSFFTREILYSPTFMGGLGLVFSYYLFQIRRANLISRG